MNKVIAVLVALLPAAALAQPPIPDTRAGAIFEAWLTSFNSGDARQIEAFKTAYERKGEVEELLRLREETGGFELLRIEVSEPKRLVVLIKERESDRAERFQLTATGDGKGENLRMELRTTPLPDEFAVPRLSLDAALNALSRRADELAKEDGFSGALLVARNNEVLLEAAYGKADRESGKQNSLDTQFRLGSMNKMFTAVSVFQLVERGKLSLAELDVRAVIAVERWLHPDGAASGAEQFRQNAAAVFYILLSSPIEGLTEVARTISSRDKRGIHGIV